MELDLDQIARRIGQLTLENWALAERAAAAEAAASNARALDELAARRARRQEGPPAA